MSDPDLARFLQVVNTQMGDVHSQLSDFRSEMQQIPSRDVLLDTFWEKLQAALIA